MSELIRKISAKTVVGKIQKPEKATSLFHVFGIARSVRTGESNYGPWVALIGQFEATNLETGETFVAPQCFLPEPIGSMMAAQVQNEDTESVQFGLEVGIKPADTAVGYEYTSKALVESKEADPLADLRAKMPALEAPKETASKAEERKAAASKKK